MLLGQISIQRNTIFKKPRIDTNFTIIFFRQKRQSVDSSNIEGRHELHSALLPRRRAARIHGAFAAVRDAEAVSERKQSYSVY